MLKLHNSLTNKLEEFKPADPKRVAFYMCGPTVYDFVHIGNLRSILLGDILRRTLVYNSMGVRFVMNITDVGHMTSDSDAGEDKMEKNAQTPADVYAVAEKYTQAFLENIRSLNILNPDVMPKASEHVAQQIEIIEKLIEKGFAYESSEAVYFDVAKFPDYNRLTGQNLDDMLLGARQEVVHDPQKKNPFDFVLWFKAVGRYASHILRWPSPWGDGFPGWHIECSAMSRQYLGQPLDIHAGGIDLKFPHHTNEIAQSEAAFGAQFAKYWVHGEHLLINSGKMAKSEGTGLTLNSIIEKHFDPLAFRYLALTTHYRSKLNFTWDSLTGAQNALRNLYREISAYDAPKIGCTEYEQRFLEALNDDLNTAKALAIVWDLIKSENPSSAKLASLFKFDEVLGLGFKEIWEQSHDIPQSVKKLAQEREEARKARDFEKSDELRKQIEGQGFVLEDTLDGFLLKKKF